MTASQTAKKPTRWRTFLARLYVVVSAILHPFNALRVGGLAPAHRAIFTGARGLTMFITYAKIPRKSTPLAAQKWLDVFGDGVLIPGANLVTYTCDQPNEGVLPFFVKSGASIFMLRYRLQGASTVPMPDPRGVAAATYALSQEQVDLASGRGFIAPDAQRD